MKRTILPILALLLSAATGKSQTHTLTIASNDDSKGTVMLGRRRALDNVSAGDIFQEGDILSFNGYTLAIEANRCKLDGVLSSARRDITRSTVLLGPNAAYTNKGYNIFITTPATETGDDGNAWQVIGRFTSSMYVWVVGVQIDQLQQPNYVVSRNADGSYKVYQGSTATVIARAKEGYHVEGWNLQTGELHSEVYDDYAMENPYRYPAVSYIDYIMSGDRAIEVTFAENMYSVTFDSPDAIKDGKVSVTTQNGDNPATDVTANVDQNGLLNDVKFKSVVTLTATDGYLFSEISGIPAESTTISEDKTTATFTMPANNVNIRFNLKRDITKQMTATVSTQTFHLVKNGDRNVPDGDYNATLVDILANQTDVTSLIGQDDGFDATLQLKDGDTWNDVDVNGSFVAGTYRWSISAKESSDYIGTFTSNEFEICGYDLAFGTSEHGSLSFTVDGQPASTAAAEQTVVVTVSPDDGYSTKAVTARPYTGWGNAEARLRIDSSADINILTLTPTGTENQWSFTMPAHNVEVGATYKKTLSNPDITIEIEATASTTYTGEPLTPEVVVKDNGTPLLKGTDYDVDYINNVNAALIDDEKAPTAIITACEASEDYSGSNTLPFTIEKAMGGIRFDTAGFIKTLDDDQTFTCSATLEGDGTPAYSSGNEAVATVDVNTGLVTITGAGETTITATGVDGSNYKYDDLSDSYTLTVTDKRTLRANIGDATEFYNSIKDNSYYSAISSELSDAIAAAQQVSDDPAVLQTAIDQAADDIAAALQQAQDDKAIRDQLIVECTSPELTAAPGEKIDLKVNISSGVAPFTVSWTDTQGQPVGTVETSAMNEDIVVSALAEYSGEYTVTVVDAQQKSFSANATLTVTGEPLPAVFDDLSLEDESYWNGSDGKRSFISGGYRFDTEYKEEENGIYAYGFAYSNRTSSDFLTYAADRYNSCVGGGAEDTPNFGVFKMDRSHPMGAEVLGDEDRLVSGFYITNAASTYEAMQNGTDLARQFGIGDWLKVTVTGYDAAGTETGTVDFYLADFRDANAAYIIETWRWVDLTPLGKVKRLVFTMSGSDVNPWGSLNTPEYFCMDKLGGEKPEYEEPLLTSICLTRTYRTAEPVAIYNLSGVQQYELRPGVNIVKYADGTTKKILVK